MRISISHYMNYSYDSPVRLSTQYLRLYPRDTARQKVLAWKLETLGQPMRTQDGYGNVLHVLTLDKPVSEISIHAEGAVETAATLDEPSDFRGTPLSPLLFLRQTGLTRLSDEVASFAERFRRGAATLSSLRELAGAILERDGESSSEHLAHAFIGCCRHLGVPARYVSGYVYSAQKPAGASALHAWAEAWVVERWRSFDIAQGGAIGEGHIKLAIGADYLDACPMRGVRTGGGSETLIARTELAADAQQ
jgi:transglutaminase-like putative cysteine protease